ncbi:ABC transporter [Phyllobacterium zundukense]|uniref:ABC transporter n=2 Tax=Phyllobacterium zundukense TaxID=1867719 RepID=A0A2N9W310_9HYPH|nr:ABC transporter [Phyllobacterium zundukense]PIO46128.1 ABC transporter [Phyllobacterium zundukense]
MFTDELAKRISGRVFSKTPVILQTEAAECGLACLAMVAGRYGHEMDLPAIRRRFTASIKGTTLKDLVQVGGQLRLATRALRLDLDDLDKLRLPCILHWRHNHFVVLTRVQKNRITIIDPATGSRQVARAEVSKQFTGVALEAWPTEEFEEKNERIRIRITDLIRRTSGIGVAALQVMAISLLLELATIAMPIGFQLVLDEVVVAADYDLLTLIVIAMALMLVLQVVTAFARAFQTMVIGSRLILQWKVSLFDQLMRLPLSFFEKRHVGDVVSRFGSLDTVQRTLTTSAIQSFLDGLMSVFLIFMMWLYGGWLLIVALVSTGFYTIIRAAIYGHYRSISEETIIHTAQESSHFMESVRGIGSLKVLNLESRRRGTWINHLVERVNAELRVQKFDAWFSAVGSLLFGADRILIIFLGVRAILGGDISVGMFVAFLAYKDQFATRVNGFVNTILQFRMLSLHGERVADIALADPEETDRRLGPAGAHDTSDRRPSSLEVRNVHFRYADNEASVLKGISLSVSAGECIGIAGPSGSGKTTLLKLLAGLSLPTTGQVLIDGVPLSSLGLAAYRDRVGCVLQEDRLFAGSIFENITAFDSSADPAWVEACAQMAAIHNEIVAMPMGYETLVGDMGSSLSGGQKQRVVLARAIYRRPSLLLLDEATSNLDHANEQAINAAVRCLPITRIIIAHREATLAMTDRVLCFDGAGDLIEQSRSLTTNSMAQSSAD